MNPALAQSGGSKFEGSSRADASVGGVDFGSFGGLTLNTGKGIDSRWLVGGAVAVAALFTLYMIRRR